LGFTEYKINSSQVCVDDAKSTAYLLYFKLVG